MRRVRYANMNAYLSVYAPDSPLKENLGDHGATVLYKG